MRRSEINRIIDENRHFLRDMNFYLPPWADWTAEDWRQAPAACRDVARRKLGWDVIDFGKGDFAAFGLLLFTIRNGDPEALRTGVGKPYAEKILIVEEGQVTPTHMHKEKMEDIINRGGGTLVIQLWNADAADQLADTEVTVMTDDVARRLPAGGTVELGPGESITLPQQLYHKFWGKPGDGKILCGEVSSVNDDDGDNYFIEPLPRFPPIDEDEAPRQLLCNDYPSYYPHLT